MISSIKTTTTTIMIRVIQAKINTKTKIKTNGNMVMIKIKIRTMMKPSKIKVVHSSLKPSQAKMTSNNTINQAPSNLLIKM